MTDIFYKLLDKVIYCMEIVIDFLPDSVVVILSFSLLLLFPWIMIMKAKMNIHNKPKALSYCMCAIMYFLFFLLGSIYMIVGIEIEWTILLALYIFFTLTGTTTMYKKLEKEARVEIKRNKDLAL